MTVFVLCAAFAAAGLLFARLGIHCMRDQVKNGGEGLIGPAFLGIACAALGCMIAVLTGKTLTVSLFPSVFLASVLTLRLLEGLRIIVFGKFELAPKPSVIVVDEMPRTLVPVIVTPESTHYYANN